MPAFPFYSGSIAAGGTFNPLAGWQYEFLPFPAHVRLLHQSDRAGTMKCAIYSGAECIQEEAPVQGGATAAGNTPSEYTAHPIEFVAPAGDRLKLAYRNTDAAAGYINGIVIINPVG